MHMKRLVYPILVLAAVAAFIGFRQSAEFMQYTHIASPTPYPAPVSLSIPSLAINAPVESVGKDADGSMDVPKDDMNVGWYRYGPRPGQPGSAVIAGHLDSKTGPAIFYSLSSLKPGDEVQVVVEGGRILTFTVEKKETYPDSSFPIAAVFGPSREARLNLITCQGVFDHASQNYSDRLVVYTRLKE